ncbi:hypothetical protein QBC35DRAFT_246146 [Podospora australis]|uniref:Dolichyl-diphosphooligosaccharide-protein glycosyltransferase subunit OST5 n=1 Tax=Podospora australis TaxID=1536484 RepID=A0AAN6X1K9_9PEZI|nr:hypothetical protein QBC35DRAFT_246146 [Podospora australis]
MQSGVACVLFSFFFYFFFVSWDALGKEAALSLFCRKNTRTQTTTTTDDTTTHTLYTSQHQNSELLFLPWPLSLLTVGLLVCSSSMFYFLFSLRAKENFLTPGMLFSCLLVSSLSSLIARVGWRGV